jgi:hypothetical protein
LAVIVQLLAGFIAQHHATQKSPIENLIDHLADPYKNTFATNGKQAA